jgi:hypothetical protein
MSNMGQDVEKTLIEGELLGELYLRHAPDAVRLAYLLTGDGGLAEDLVQDTFVRPRYHFKSILNGAATGPSRAPYVEDRLGRCIQGKRRRRSGRSLPIA